MSSKSLRMAVATAAALSAGVAGIVVGPHGAFASHAGASGLLSASNGGQTIKFSDTSSLSTVDHVSQGAWSADGSRFAYVDGQSGIDTLRWDDGGDTLSIYDGSVDSSVNQHPTFSQTGSIVYWSQQAAAGTARTIQFGWTDGGGGGDAAAEPGFDYMHPDAGPGFTLVFQRQADSGGTPTGQADVYGFTDWWNQTSPSLMVSNASSPAISPDGTKLAFVRLDGTHTQVYVSDLSGNGAVAVTADAVNHDNPTWSPDGNTIAFNEGSAVYTALADSSQAASPVVVNGLSGLPAYQPSNKDHVVRLWGHGRFETAAATSQSHWATAGDASDTRVPAQSVTLSRSDTYADALGGAALAAAKQGPLLMTPPTSLDTTTAAEITRVLGTNHSATVYLLGSTTALSQTVHDAVAAMGYNVVRIAGQSRFGTAVAIATAINPHPDLILAATGMNFPDALGAGAAAGSYDLPGSGLSAVVVLTNNTTLPSETKAFLDNNPSSVVFGIGSQGLAATAAYGPIDVATDGGFFPPSRYTTSMLTAWAFFGAAAPATGIATSLNWPDALAGGALMATLNGPVLISAPTGLDPFVGGTLDVFSASLGTAYVFGSSTVVPDAVANECGTLISGPGGFLSSENPTTMAASPQINGARSLGSSTPQANNRTPAQISAALQALSENK